MSNMCKGIMRLAAVVALLGISAADVNGDKRVDIVDVTAIISLILNAK